MSQVILADEINRATPRTQSALLEAMQERQVTVDGVTRPVPRPLSRTPLEFLPAMKELLPTVREELELITHTYTRVRYGDYPESKAEIDHVERAWQRVLEDGKRLKKSGWQTFDLSDE